MSGIEPPRNKGWSYCRLFPEKSATNLWIGALARRHVGLALSLILGFAPALAQEPRVGLRDLSDVVLDGKVLLQSRADVQVDPARCRQTCVETAGCAGFTSFPDGRCLIFSGVTHQRAAAAGTVSGMASTTYSTEQGGRPSAPKAGVVEFSAKATCPSRYRPIPNQTIVGGDLSLRGLAVSFERCAELCIDKKECVAFAWAGGPETQHRDDKCQLKSRLRPMVDAAGALLCEKADDH